jgi:DNA-binding CsgD family transcriptional regulator
VNPSESPFEYQLCLLTKLGLRAADIAVLTSHTPSGISRAKERLFAKLTGKPGKAVDFDSYIKKLG